MFPIYNVIFFIFAIVLIAAATMVIISHNPIHAVLFLILAFFASAVLWMMIQEEFLSLVLIFVYLGAVMTLFLFVIMMLNIDLSKIEQKFVQFLLPIGLLAIFLLITTIVVVIRPRYFSVASTTLSHLPANFSNAKVMGILLYTHYLLPFEIAAVILLVAIIAAIVLAFNGRKFNTKSQRIRKQLETTKENRLRVIKMKAEKP